MKVLIMTDTHDRVAHMRFLLEKIHDLEIGAIIHAGDLVEPESLEVFEDIGVPVYYVFGNNEGRTEDIIYICEEIGIHWALDINTFELDGKTFAVTHYPQLAEKIMEKKFFDVVCCGHSHFAKIRKYEYGGMFINAGNVAGLREDPRYVIYDTEKHEAAIHELGYRQKVFKFHEE